MEKAGTDEFAFLGEEFLVWLWWQAETKGGLHAVGGDERIGIALDRVLEFHDEATDVRVVVRGDAPTRAPEAREALSRGMRLTRAGLIISIAEDNVSVVLDGPSLDLRSVKAARPEGDSPEDRDAAALAALFGLAEAIDRVYRKFLIERCAATFNKEIAPALLDWLRRSSEGRRSGAPRRTPAQQEAAAG